MAYQRIQLRRDTAARWAMVNPVLAQGEPGYETDTGRQKIGNGTAKWTALPYAGEQGPAGPTGPAGAPGPQGERGGSGLRGPQGPIGASGPGNLLYIGRVEAGPVASASITGNSPAQTLNLVLPKGETGAVGPAGPTGPQGPQGEAAGVVIKGKVTRWPPSDDPDAGDIYIVPNPAPAFVPPGFSGGDAALWDGDSWENAGPIQGPKGDKGDTGNAGATGSPGAPGLAGPTGPAGPANTLTVGSVTQGLPGSQPFVSITGQSPFQTISFVLPAAQANTLTIGSVDVGPNPQAWITGNPPNQILNLTLPNPAVYQSTSFYQNPQDVSVEEGDDVTFTAAASSTEWPIVYVWQSSDDGVVWDDLAGSGTESLTFKGDTQDDQSLYRCTAATPSIGRVYSTIARLRVSAIPGLENGAQRFAWGFENSPATDYLIGGQLWKAGDRVFTAQKTSTDGVQWTPLVGGPAQNPAFFVNAVRNIGTTFCMLHEPPGSNVFPNSDWRPNDSVLLSSDGISWSVRSLAGTIGQMQVSGPCYRRGQFGTGPQPNTLAWSGQFRIQTDSQSGNVIRQSWQNRATPDFVTFPTDDVPPCRIMFSDTHDPAGYGTVEYRGAIGTENIRRLGFIGWAGKLGSGDQINDFIYGGNTGLVNGRTMHVGMGETKWYYVEPGSAAPTAASLPRPAGYDMHVPAYANGWWLGTSKTQRGVYFTSQDLQTWYTHTARIPPQGQYGGVDPGFVDLGRPYVIGDQFVIPVTSGSTLLGVLRSVPSLDAGG